MTEHDYISYLSLLKNNREYDLINTVLNLNRNIITLNQDLIDFFKNIVKKDKKSFRKIKVKRIINLSDLNSDIKNNPSKKYYSECITAMKTDTKMSSTKIINYYEIVTPDEYIKRNNILLNKKTQGEKKLLKILQDHNKVILETGDKFGEYAFESNNQKRTASIITIEECHLGILEKKEYEDILKDIYEKQKKLSINYLISNDIFLGCDKILFSKKIFSCFIKEKYHQNHSLLVENKIFDSIYFIKKGEFKVSCHKTIKEIEEIIKYFKSKLTKFNNVDLKGIIQHDESKFNKFMNTKLNIKVIKIKLN